MNLKYYRVIFDCTISDKYRRRARVHVLADSAAEASRVAERLFAVTYGRLFPRTASFAAVQVLDMPDYNPHDNALHACTLNEFVF